MVRYIISPAEGHWRGRGEVSVFSKPDIVEKWVCVSCGVIDCGHHCCCTVGWQQVQMSAWSTLFCTWAGWSGDWMSCPSAAARHGEDERGCLGWLWSCSTSSSSPLTPDFSSPNPTTELAFSTSLFSLLASPALMPPPQHITAENCEEQSTGY